MSDILETADEFDVCVDVLEDVSDDRTRIVYTDTPTKSVQLLCESCNTSIGSLSVDSMNLLKSSNSYFVLLWRLLAPARSYDFFFPIFWFLHAKFIRVTFLHVDSSHVVSSVFYVRHPLIRRRGSSCARCTSVLCRIMCKMIFGAVSYHSHRHVLCVCRNFADSTCSDVYVNFAEKMSRKTIRPYYDKQLS